MDITSQIYVPVLSQEILIHPELSHPCKKIHVSEQTMFVVTGGNQVSISFDAMNNLDAA